MSSFRQELKSEMLLLRQRSIDMPLDRCMTIHLQESGKDGIY